jgi:thymidylate kinase
MVSEQVSTLTGAPAATAEPASTWSEAVDTNPEPRSLPESAPVRALFSSLDDLGARYCHWKSNIRLRDTLAGKEDIDILVHPRDASLLQQAIAANGYKLTVARRGAGHPGVFHATALDEERGQLVDLHAYHQLVSGDSLVKSYRFPVEDQLLAGATTQAGVKIPAPAAELVLFLIRILLKHSSLAETLLVNRKYHEVCGELSWLLQRADLAQAALICRDWFPTISVPIADMIEQVAQPELRVGRMLLGLRIRRDLRGLRRIGTVSAGLSRMRRLSARFTARFWPRRDRSLLAGGAWIAFVGPKGTGKTTLARSVCNALGKQLDVKLIHVGKPPATILSFVPRIFVAPARRALPAERLSEYEKPERRAERRYSFLYVFRKYLVAHDRRHLLTRAMRAATAGTIVISDRCPGTNFTGVDGSAFDDAAVERASSRLQRWLMQNERQIYATLPKPRLVVKLTADVATAIRRDSQRKKKGGPDSGTIRRRWSLETVAEFEGSIVAVIDASGALDDTLRQCVREAWAVL